MARRVTWIGTLLRVDREAGRAAIIRVLRRYKGNMTKSAHDLGFNRQHLFKLLWRESLWHELDAIRAEFPKVRHRTVEPEWLAATRAALQKGE